jgi:hypothetical protein
MFPHIWFGRRGLVEWALPSSDINSLNWGFPKAQSMLIKSEIFVTLAEKYRLLCYRPS